MTDLAGSDLHEDADDAPHHPPDKVRCLDPELNDVVFGFDLDPFHFDNR